MDQCNKGPTNVSRPLILSLHSPTDFGFYDLRLRETQREQIRVAKQFGIDAFCYHYYWFSGKRLLLQPIDDMLRDPEADMPFLLCAGPTSRAPAHGMQRNMRFS